MSGVKSAWMELREDEDGLVRENAFTDEFFPVIPGMLCTKTLLIKDWKSVQNKEFPGAGVCHKADSGSRIFCFADKKKFYFGENTEMPGLVKGSTVRDQIC